jgi:hypothetical protein
VAATTRTSSEIGVQPAHALQHALLQDAQHLGLGLEGHVADLVEEDGAALGRLEAAHPARVGPGEGALLVAEQLALHQLAGDGGAVHGDEGPALSRAAVMERLRHQLLAGAALAADQHGEIGLGHLLDGLEDAAASSGPSRRCAEPILALDALEEQAVLALRRVRSRARFTTRRSSSLSKGFGT